VRSSSRKRRAVISCIPSGSTDHAKHHDRTAERPKSLLDESRRGVIPLNQPQKSVASARKTKPSAYRSRQVKWLQSGFVRHSASSTDPQTKHIATKVEALGPYDAWISGIRRDQSPSRATTPKLQWSERYDVWKLHPLADWDEKRVWAYIQVNEIPYNPLHDAGFRPIGFISYTRPISHYEEERPVRSAGTEPLECGHFACNVECDCSREPSAV